MDKHAKVFETYDRDGDGVVNRQDMQESIHELASKHRIDLSRDKIGAMTDAIFQTAKNNNNNASVDEKDGGPQKSSLSLTDWDALSRAALARRPSYVITPQDETPKSFLRKVINYLVSYRQQIVWLCIFFAFQFALFGIGIDRYYRELPGSPYPFDVLSMVALSFGLVVQVNTAVLLLGPAMRWTSGQLRKTCLAKILPFDSMVSFHIILGCTTIFCGAMHVILFLIHFCEHFYI